MTSQCRPPLQTGSATPKHLRLKIKAKVRARVKGVTARARTCHSETQVLQAGDCEKDHGIDAVNLLSQVHSQRLGRPARQLPQLLADLLLLEQWRRLLQPHHVNK